MNVLSRYTRRQQIFRRVQTRPKPRVPLNLPRSQTLTWPRCSTIAPVGLHDASVSSAAAASSVYRFPKRAEAHALLYGGLETVPVLLWSHCCLLTRALRTAVEVLLSLCTNLAVARSKTGEYKAAVQAAEDALLLQPANGELTLAKLILARCCTTPVPTDGAMRVAQ